MLVPWKESYDKPMTKTEMPLVIKNPPANAGDIRDVGLIPGSGRSLGGGHSNPLQYSCLENPMDRGAWWATVHGVTKRQTWRSDYHFHFHMTNVDSTLKSITLLTKVCIVKSYGFFSSHVWMWKLDHKEGWVPKNWCFPPVVLEKTLESPLNSKEINPFNLKENQPWILVGRTDAEALILWPLNGKEPDTGKDWS